MPRLVILCEFSTLLGGERSMLSTLAAIRAAGFDVHVAAPPAGALAAAVRALGVPLVEWTTHDTAGVRRLSEQIRGDLAELIAREKPDLVHANSLSTARMSGPVIAAVGVPSIGHLRDIVKLSQQAVADLNCHRQLVAVSAATRAFHMAQGLDAAKCAVIHNGVDLNVFRPRPTDGYLHAELGISKDVPLVATIGQIGLRKGMDVVLAAARHVPGVHWLVVGERTSKKEESREFERRLHATASEPPLAGRVHFLGSRTDVPRLMGECALLVHAARQEPLGRVLLEAAACGLPVVATDAGGTREIFPSEAEGAVLVPVDDPGKLAAAVNAILGDEQRCKTLSAAGRARAEAAFDVRKAASRLIDLYRRMLKL